MPNTNQNDATNQSEADKHAAAMRADADKRIREDNATTYYQGFDGPENYRAVFKHGKGGAETAGSI